ncbi:MAG: C10 family peptidase [Candidatus Cloacimonetes bacterium]|nr:C10 family peptidase [Candidatus Cloacimonadota bacterium]
MRQNTHQIISKIAVLSIAMLFLCLPLIGAFVQPEQAIIVAQTWLRDGPAPLRTTPAINEIECYSNGTFSPAALQYRAEESTLPLLYVVYTNEGQFVVVSADDNSVPVLGYSTEIRPKPQTISPEYAWWISKYAQQIQYIRDNDIMLPENQAKWSELFSPNYSFDTRNQRAVNPLLATTWDQGWPYNELCPVAAGGPGGHVYAGCVATAMGQVMKYWSHPTTGVGDHGYTDASPQGEDPSYGYQFANFGATTYLWEQMPNSISSSNIPIATLLRHAGVAVDMNYDLSGSGAQSPDAADAMIAYFSYPNALFRYKPSYTEANWLIMMKAQLDEGSPMYYGGHGTSGGHAWVMDGYDAANMFHMNFGWGGSNNGNFLLTAISNSNLDFNDSQGAVINTIPANYSLSNAKLQFNYPQGATVGTTLTIGVKAPPILGSWDVNHFEFQLTYDSYNLSYDGNSIAGTIAANGTVTVTETEPGYLNVSWDGTTDLLGPGTLMNFNFTPHDVGEYLFDMADMKFNTSSLAQTEYVFVPVAAPVASLAQSVITMTNVMNLAYDTVGTTDLRTTYLLPSWNVTQYQFNITYIPAKLEFVGLETIGTLSAGSTPVAVENSPGNITVTCTSPDPLTEDGVLLKLKFKAIGNTSNLSIAQVGINSFMFNTTPITAASGCTFRLSGHTSNEDELATPAPALEIYPNPFATSTALKFNSVSNAPASFNVYNLKGQLVRQLVANDGKAAEISWDGRDAKGNSVAGGIYLIRWQQGTDSGNAKVLILK